MHSSVPASPVRAAPVLVPLAHQGGWDEILLVVGPLAVIGGLMWVANRRVTAQIEAAETEADGDGASEGEADSGGG